MLHFDSSETPPMSETFKLKQNKDMDGPTLPPGNPLAGQKFVFQSTEWNRHKKHPRSVSHPPNYWVL